MLDDDGNVAEGRSGTCDHEQVREARDGEPEVGGWPIGPPVPQFDATRLSIFILMNGPVTASNPVANTITSRS